jgi:hypothetical protein
MPAMLGRRHSNSVAEEDGRSTGRPWTEGGQRRLAEPLEGLHRLYTSPPGRGAVVSHRRGGKTGLILLHLPTLLGKLWSLKWLKCRNEMKSCTFRE